MTARWAVLAAIAAAYPATSAAQDAKLPEGPGRALVEKACAKCHTLDGILRVRHAEEGWAKIVDNMVARGVVATDDEIDRIIVYLARTFGPKVNVNAATEAELTAALFTKETAAALIAHREKNGAFKSWDDLEKIPGVEKTDREQLQARVVFE